MKKTILKSGKPIITAQRLIIVGQGAIGLLCYHHLNKVTPHLSLLSSKQPYQSSNVTAAQYIYTGYQQKKAKPYPIAYAQSQEIEQADIVIFCLKSYQINSAVKSISNKLKLNALLVLAHNGMGTFAEVVKLLPKKQRILAMLTTHGCLRNSPLTIKHTGLGHSDIGLLSGEMSPNEKSQLNQLLNSAMPTFNFEENIKNKQWQKLAINCVINPLTALNDIENGEINSAKFDDITSKLIGELVVVAQAEGIILNEEKLKKTVIEVAKATAKNSSSMRCDVIAKRQTEIDYINGYIHRLGIKHCIATPVNTQIWQAVNTIEAAF